ncbi:MAG: branched-chain amino acid ABC transporter permease [Candidatus Leucobacter sulfamidivorax]|nr:branched-chain amino acid ABC transporter permease [Candidatus Leucobacter sulfamidivorax]
MVDAGVILSGLLTGTLYALIGLGLTLLSGVMRLVNLAHGELMMVGAYLASVVLGLFGVDPLLTLVIVVPVVMLVGYPLQRHVFTRLLRRNEEAPMVATFGLSQLVIAILVILFGGNVRSLSAPYATQGLELLGTTVRVSSIITAVISVVLVVATYLVVQRTQWGAALRASAVDPQTASTMGINVERVYALTFAVSAAFAAIAGILVGIGFAYSPTSGAKYMLIGFTVVVLGGFGSVLGTLWAGLGIGVIEAVGAAVFGTEFRELVIYATFILILIVVPIVVRIVKRSREAKAQRRIQYERSAA